jgi:5'-3' exoribonuclease 2
LYSQESPIIDFYPEDFKIDLNGKKFAWQGVALLPFVDEKRLKKAVKSLFDELTEDESKSFSPNSLSRPVDLIMFF